MARPPGSEPLGSLADLPCFQLYLGWRRAQAFYKPLLVEGTNPQRMYVMTLLDEQGPLGVGALARALDLELGSVSGLLTRMEKEGLVERRTDEANRAAVQIHLTRKGRARFQKASREIEDADRELMAALAPRDVEGLRRVVAALQRLTHERT